MANCVRAFMWPEIRSSCSDGCPSEVEAGMPDSDSITPDGLTMSSEPLPVTAKKNIEAIAQVEQQLHGRLSGVEKIGNGIAAFFGSLGFIAAHTVFITVWIVLNLRAPHGTGEFDPYPFPFLDFIVGVEFIFLTTFVLMNQKLQSRRQEHWGHLTLQLCLLTEQEVTKNMQMLHLVCKHLGLEKAGADAESKDLAKATPVVALMEEIEKAREAGQVESASRVGRVS